MEAKKGHPTTIDEYMGQFPEDVRRALGKIRAAIHEAAPDAVERISYRMPAFYLNGYLVWFAAFQHHIGLYPKPSGLQAFTEELSAFEGTTGSVHFPLDQPPPLELIRKIVQFRVAENGKASGLKKKAPVQPRRPHPGGGGKKTD